jgi:hypothetical protein
LPILVGSKPEKADCSTMMIHSNIVGNFNTSSSPLSRGKDRGNEGTLTALPLTIVHYRRYHHFADLHFMVRLSFLAKIRPTVAGFL